VNTNSAVLRQAHARYISGFIARLIARLIE